MCCVVRRLPPEAVRSNSKRALLHRPANCQIVPCCFQRHPRRTLWPLSKACACASQSQAWTGRCPLQIPEKAPRRVSRSHKRDALLSAIQTASRTPERKSTATMCAVAGTSFCRTRVPSLLTQVFVPQETLPLFRFVRSLLGYFSKGTGRNAPRHRALLSTRPESGTTKTSSTEISPNGVASSVRWIQWRRF
jgi:hypothetical protein